MADLVSQLVALAQQPGGSPTAQLVRSVTPLFSQEGPAVYAKAYAHNAPFAKPGPYQTNLAPAQEQAFRSWVAQHQIPFDPNAKTADYDMRGYWLSQASGGQGRAANGHFPDTYKTPYDSTFSAESRYATPNNPFAWRGNTLIDRRNGQVISNG